MYKTLIIAIATLFSTLTFGQEQRGRGSSSTANGSISGRIADAKTNQGLEFVTVAVYKQGSATPIGGSVSQDKGEFTISNLPLAKLEVKVSFMGYKTHSIQDIELTNNITDFDLGKIKITADTKVLQEVEVISSTPTMSYDIDKKIISVSDQATNASETAIEILENVPSINVDIDGNVSLRGSSSFTLLIDGMPTVMDISDALRTIPAMTIQDIEIITNPSARFDAEGSAGVINIILKKNKLRGVSGLVGGSLGNFGRYGVNSMFNVTNKQWTFNFGGNFDNRAGYYNSESERRQISNGNETFIHQIGESSRGGESKGVQGDVEYRINRKNTIRLGGSYGLSQWKHGSDTYFNEEENNQTIQNYRNLAETTRDYKRYQVRGYYVSQIGSNSKHKIELTASYNEYFGDDVETVRYLDANDLQIGGTINTEKGPSATFRGKLDYYLPFSNGNKLESGIQAQIGGSEDAGGLYNYNATSEVYDRGQNNYFFNAIYDRNIYAAYSMYAGHAGELGYQVGLRAEHTDRHITSSTTSLNTKINRLDLFPSAHFSYKLPNDNQLMLNYTRRIQRARSWYLEPFITIENAYTVRQGNPDLKPEYVNSMEMAWLKNLSKGSFSVEVYHRQTLANITRVSSPYIMPSGAEVVMRRPENIGSSTATGMEAVWALNITKRFKSDLSGNLFNYGIKGYINNETLDKQSLSWTGRWNATYSFKHDLKAQLTSSYNSDIASAQGKSIGYFEMNASLKKDFFNRNLSLNIQARDILNTVKRESITETSGLYMHRLGDPFSPAVTLGLSFRFNNYKMVRQEGGNEDEF